MLSIEEVRKHDNQESCWVIIHGSVYDLSDFLDKHPGGAVSILRYAGGDATEEYDTIHPPNTIENTLPKDSHLGKVEQSTAAAEKPNPIANGVTRENQGSTTLEMCLNLNDLELAAKETLSKRAWIYYSSAAQDRRTFNHNIDDWKQIRFRPRIMRNVKKVDTRRTILGFQSNLPFFIAPCALARLGHPDGELCLVRGAARANIPYCPSNSSSVSHDALADCLAASEARGGCLFFQLYVKRSRKDTLDSIRRARELGYKALVITVDTNVVGIREDDDKFKIREALKNGQQHISPWRAALSNPDPDAVLRAPHSATLNWEDLHWIKEAWQNSGPICLKGILTAEDAQIACDYGVDAIYLSNHGGRQLDSATSALGALMEIRQQCPEVLSRCQVLLDGGVRRGGDILKALCLGAAGVGLGRPFMYALSAYGTDGVHKAIEMLNDEIETGMRLLGATCLDDLSPRMINTRELEILITQGTTLEHESIKCRL